MPLPKKDKKFIQEVVEPVVQEEVVEETEFLQEIKEPEHEEVLEETAPKKTRKSKKLFE